MSAKKPKSRAQKIWHAIRELFAAAVWLFAFTKLFIYDADVLFVRWIPWLRYIFQFRFFVILGALAVLWLVLGGRIYRRLIAYVVFYPLTILWRIVKLIAKNWATVIVFLPAIQSFVVTFKWRFILGTLAILAALAVMIVSQRHILMFAMFVLFSYLALHYIMRVRTAFQPNSVFGNIGVLVGVMWEQTLTNFRNKELRDEALIDTNSPEFRKKHVENLKTLYIHNLTWSFFARKLDEVFSNRRTDLYFLWALIQTFILTVVVFAFEYFGLYKIQPTAFLSSGSTSFWSFLLFSFNAIIHAGFASLTPNSSWALLFANLETLASLLIGVIFFFVLLTSNRERYRQEIKTVIDNLSEGADQTAGFIQKEFKITMIEAEAQIVQENPDFGKMLESFGRIPTVSQVEAAGKPSSPNADSVEDSEGSEEKPSS